MAATNTYEYLRCNLSTIEEIIGYRFQDRNLLIQALTSSLKFEFSKLTVT